MLWSKNHRTYPSKPPNLQKRRTNKGHVCETELLSKQSCPRIAPLACNTKQATDLISPTTGQSTIAAHGVRHIGNPPRTTCDFSAIASPPRRITSGVARVRFMAPQPECALPRAHQSWQGSAQTWQRHGEKGIWNTRRAQG